MRRAARTEAWQISGISDSLPARLFSMTAAVEELGVIHLMAAACRRLGVDLLGGGTDINAALAYCEQKIEQPAQTHLVLVTELYEGGDAQSMLARIAALKQSGVNVIVLLALSDDGHPGYDSNHAEKIAAMDSLVFACTPDQFPDLLATALTRQDIVQWTAAQDIALIRGA